MVNDARGESELKLGGKVVRLALTLNALCEIEEALGVDETSKLGEAMEKLSARKLRAVLLALARGGGWKDLTEEHLGELDFDDMPTLSKAINRAFNGSRYTADVVADDTADDGEDAEKN